MASSADTTKDTSVMATEIPFHVDNGDMELVVMIGDKRAILQVSSHALSYASPVWAKFINPPFPQIVDEDATANKQMAEDVSIKKQLDFTEDNSSALVILLQIAHLQFAKVPTALITEDLYEVARLCDMYDCTKLVGPWLSRWLVVHDGTINLYLPGKRMFIAWTFGREAAFKTVAKRLVELIELDIEGKIVLHGKPLNHLEYPPDIIGKSLE